MEALSWFRKGSRDRDYLRSTRDPIPNPDSTHAARSRTVTHPPNAHGIQEVEGSTPFGSTRAILLTWHSATSTAAVSYGPESACCWDGSGAFGRSGRTFDSGLR
jgi:hypothetical protein